MKIYIIDDDIDIVGALTASLEAAGYEVGSQYEEEELVEKIGRFNPDLIILDVMFPGDPGAGFRMARTIRHQDRLSRVPIIMLSAVNKEGDFLCKFSSRDIDEVYLPVTEFVEKPVDPAVLIAKIKKLTA
jgi:DNA-binding response OmpR family regulator